MSTLVSWFEARLKATNGVVKEFRVAFLPAGMATRQPVHTMHVTATFRGKPEEVVWIRNGNGCVWVSRALKLEGSPDVVVASQEVDDGCPRRDAA
jgi:hypothetical protein